jgi:hypothetical protein
VQERWCIDQDLGVLVWELCNEVEGRLTELGLGAGHNSVADWDYQIAFYHCLNDSWIVEGEEFG